MRRKRIELEADIVRAAQEFIAALKADPEHLHVFLIGNLGLAVDRLNAYLPTEPAARGAFMADAPETSAWAALRAPRGALGKKVLAHIRNVHFQGGVGSTDDAMEARMQKSHQSLSSARNGLCEGGWLMDSGQKRRTRSGNWATVWTLTPAALAAFEKEKTSA